MRKCLLVGCVLWAMFAMAEKHGAKVVPKVTFITLDEQAVTVIHLSPGYTTSIKLPEEISSITVGDPASFKAEHSEVEPRLVFLKPITTQPAQSNALITTQSGQEISLNLISDGQRGAGEKVDFVLEYAQQKSFLIGSDRSSTFDIPSTGSRVAGRNRTQGSLDPAVAELLKQSAKSSPEWKGNELQFTLGDVVADGTMTVLPFSVLNHFNTPIELLPPQIQLYGSAKRKGIKAEPIPIGEYRITRDRLKPGERADGVIVFERPDFKESGERLMLQLATVDAVNRPLVIPIPFVAPIEGGRQ